MNATKIGKYWACQTNIPFLNRDELEPLILSIEGVSSCEYVFSPSADMYRIEYQSVEFTLVFDLVYGSDLRSISKDNLLNLGEQFIRALENLILLSRPDEQ